MGLIGPGEQLLVPVVMPGEGGGGGISSDSALALPIALRQEPNKGWPVERPNHPGPLILIGWDDPPAWTGSQYDQWIKIPRVHVPLVETFASQPLGPVPADEFAQYWAAAYAPVEIAEHPLSSGRVLRFVGPGGTARGVIVFERFGSETDQDMLARVIRPAPANLSQNAIGLIVRASKIGTSRAGYLLNVRSTSPAEITLTKFQGNASTTLATLVLPSELSSAVKAAAAVVMMRLRAVGSEITGSIWLAGADESTASVLTATDNGVVSGYAGVTSASGNYEGLVDYVAIAYGGNVAPIGAGA